MKKLNKNGFTLVELLVVLVILVVIMAIAIPSVTSSVERSKQKQKDSKIELLESAAEIYVDRHKNSYSENVTYTIFIKDIICDGLLTKEQMKDPLNESYTLSGYVSYTKSGSIYKFEEMGVDFQVDEIADDPDNYRLAMDDNLIC